MTHAEVIHGDCLEVMRAMPSSSVDMILCDLPYGTTACKWDQVIPFEPLWAEYERLIKPNGAIVLTASQPFTSALVMSNPQAFRHEWIWKKNRGSNFAATKYQPMKEHESVLVFSFQPPSYFPQLQERSASGSARVQTPIKASNTGKREAYGGMKATNTEQPSALRVPSSVQLFNTQVGLHPTQKPVALFEYLIRTYTNEGDTVLDNAAGSGTTGVAALRCGRNAILIEKDAGYVQVIRDRLRAAQPALLETA